MPGANYMGGKRNAARARGKDATGKAQRNHFGKKRFEILRTGLCKGQASVGRATDYVGNASRGRPEISLAHARRDRALERQSGTSGSMLSQPFVFPSTPRRSSPRSASNRSKILTILDADNPLAQRAQVDKILQTPDLLGLSTRQDRSCSSRAYHTPPRSSGYRYGMESTYSDVSPGIRTPCSSTYMSPCEDMQEPSGMVQSHRTRESAVSRRSPSNPESTFVPMCMDSSPPPYVHDSGYTETWPDVHETLSCYEPARAPFYSASSSYLLSPTSCEAPGMLDWKRTGTFDDHRPDSWATSGSPSQPQSSRPVRPSLPPTLAQARFLSDLPAIDAASVQHEALSLSPSGSPGRFWSGHSSHLPDSEDIPQASFSLSPPANIVLQPTVYGLRVSYDEDVACDTDIGHASTDDSTNDSVYSLLGESGDYSEQDGASPNDNFADTQQITLACVLNGALFEDSDPWRTLDEILDLPPAPTVLRDTEPGPFCLVISCDRSGVGYIPTTAAGSGTPDLRSINLELSAYADEELGEGDCVRGGLHKPREPMPEDPGSEPDRLLNSYDPFPAIPHRGFSSDVARAASEEVDAALPRREMSEDPVPTLASPSILASNLDASLEPSVGVIEDEQQDAQVVMSCRNTSLPADVAVQDPRSSSPMVTVDVGHRSCSELQDRMMDGPSLFLDDGLSDSEE